jgi:hypothetical protein
MRQQACRHAQGESPLAEFHQSMVVPFELAAHIVELELKEAARAEGESVESESATRPASDLREGGVIRARRVGCACRRECVGVLSKGGNPEECEGDRERRFGGSNKRARRRDRARVRAERRHLRPPLIPPNSSMPPLPPSSVASFEAYVSLHRPLTRLGSARPPSAAELVQLTLLLSAGLAWRPDPASQADLVKTIRSLDRQVESWEDRELFVSFAPSLDLSPAPQQADSGRAPSPPSLRTWLWQRSHFKTSTHLCRKMRAWTTI